MARINIEDELRYDPRFRRLARKIGEDAATGMLYRFWVMAQNFWGDDRALMPIADFHAEELEPVLECGLAELREGGVYARGAEERFAWYLQKRQANRSKQESKLRKTNPGHPENESRTSGNEIPASGNVAAGIPLTLTLTPTLSLILKEEGEDTAPPTSDGLEEFLSESAPAGIAALRKIFPPALIAAEVPRCVAKWLLDDERNKLGGKALYLNNWLNRAERDAREKPPLPTGWWGAQTKPAPSQGHALRNLEVAKAESEATRCDPDAMRRISEMKRNIKSLPAFAASEE